jgi:FAD/FMN-containing dehydrogenase
VTVQSIATYNINTTSVNEHYKSKHYSGPAMKIGAGVLAADAYAVGHKYGYRVVGGGCPSIGISGGYTQGGGHSLLSSTYGMSTDNVLEWEVVTAAWKYIVATPTQNKDLY